MPPAFEPMFPAHFQGRVGSNEFKGLRSCTRDSWGYAHPPSQTGRAHFFLCTSRAKESAVRYSDLRSPDCGMCNILRIHVRKRFSFRLSSWNSGMEMLAGAWTGGAEVFRLCDRIEGCAIGSPADRLRWPERTASAPTGHLE